MTTKYTTTTGVLSGTELGVSGGNWAAIPSVTRTDSHTFAEVNQVVSSLSTPGYHKKSKVLVPYVPKRNFRHPVRFIVRYPVALLPPAPRRPKQSARSYARVLRNFDVKHQKYIAKVKRCDVFQRLSDAKYARRMAVYSLIMQKIRDGRLKTIRYKAAFTSDITFNPYTKAMTLVFPLTGTYTCVRNYLPYPYNGDWIVLRQTYVGDMYGLYGNVETSWTALSSPVLIEAVAVATEAATSKALSHYNDELGAQSVHLANIIAERAQTLDLISSSLKRLLKLVLTFSLRKAFYDTIKYMNLKESKRLADDTLAFMFGVRPLVSDVYGAISAFKKGLPSDTVLVKGGGSHIEHATYSRIYPSAGSPAWYYEDVVSVRIKVTVRYVSQYTVDNSLAAELQTLGLINPAEVLWEKLPWSFVIDWFIPIGSWIQGFTSSVGLNYKRGTFSVLTIKEFTVNRTYYQSVQTTSFNDNGQEFMSAKAYKMEYVKERQVPAQPPSNKFPSFKNPLSTYHIIEMLALLRQRFK